MTTVASSASRMSSPLTRRVLLAGPGALVSSLLAVFAMPLWLPGGEAGIDNIVLPLILMPAVWAAAFFHACLDRSLLRAGLVCLALVLVNGAALAWHMTRPAGPPPYPSAQGDPR